MTTINTRTRRIGAALATTARLTAAGAAQAEVALGVTDSQSLFQFNTNNPTNIEMGNFITGLEANETVLGIDWQANGDTIYALGSLNNLYTLDRDTGEATLVGEGGFSPKLDGLQFGFDINPITEQTWVVSEADQNLRIDLDDGTASAENGLAYGMGDLNNGIDANVTAIAAGTVPRGFSATVFGIDTALDVLVTVGEDGELTTVGSLNIDLSEINGFDISQATGMAYLAGQRADESAADLWSIDLATGEASLIDEIAGGPQVTAFTVVPSPGAAFAALAAAPAFIRRCRKA